VHDSELSSSKPAQHTGSALTTLSESTDTDDYPSSKRSHHEEQVNAVAEELRGLHKDKYTGPQLRLWARMKVNGQHNSTLNPPSIPTS